MPLAEEMLGGLRLKEVGEAGYAPLLWWLCLNGCGSIRDMPAQVGDHIISGEAASLGEVG